MRRGPLILAGGTVAWAAIGVARRRRRPTRPRVAPSRAGVLVAVPLYVVLSPTMAYMIDWGGVWGGIWGFLSGVTGAIRDFVQEAIEKAVAAVMWVVNTVDDAWQFANWALGASVGALWDKATDAVNAVGHVIQETTNRIDGAFQWIRQQVREAIDAAWADLMEWIVDPIKDAVKALLGDAWDFLIALKDIGLDGIGLLLDFLRDPVGFIWDLIRDLVESAIAAAQDAAGFTWELFWGLFWPLLARQIGLPEDPQDMIDAAHLLWTVAMAWVHGDFEEGMRNLLAGAEHYFMAKIPEEVHKNSDLLVGLLEAAFGIEEPPGTIEQMLNKV